MTFLFNVIGFDFHFRFNIIKKFPLLFLLNSIDRNHHITIYCPNLTIQVNTYSVLQYLIYCFFSFIIGCQAIKF